MNYSGYFQDQNGNKYYSGIVESGTNSNGSWIKFYDGTMICSHKYAAGEISFTTNPNGTYYFKNDNNKHIFKWTYPKQFNKIPECQIMLESNAYSANGMGEVTTNTALGYVFTPYLANLKGCVWNCLAIGKWK